MLICWNWTIDSTSGRVFACFSYLLATLLFSDCARGCLNCTSGVCSECKEGLTLNRKSKRCVKLCSPADPDVKTRPGCEGKPKGREGKRKHKGKFFKVHHCQIIACLGFNQPCWTTWRLELSSFLTCFLFLITGGKRKPTNKPTKLTPNWKFFAWSWKTNQSHDHPKPSISHTVFGCNHVHTKPWLADFFFTMTAELSAFWSKKV